MTEAAARTSAGPASSVAAGSSGRRAGLAPGRHAQHQAVLRAFAEAGRPPHAAELDDAARPYSTDARAAHSEAGGESRLAASWPADGGGQRLGLGGLWLLLLPLACCGGPLLITSLVAAGALAWGALGLGAGVLVAVTILVIRRRRGRACCEPGMTS